METTIKKPGIEEIKFVGMKGVHVAAIGSTSINKPNFSPERILTGEGLVMPLFPGILREVLENRDLLNILRGRTFMVQPEPYLSINDHDYRGRYRLKEGVIERGGIISENTVIIFGGEGRWFLKVMGDVMTRLYEARFAVEREFVINKEETTRSRINTIVGIRRE
jgi:hypothetical protein